MGHWISILNFQLHRQTSLTSTQAQGRTLSFITISGTSRNACLVHAHFAISLSRCLFLLVPHTARVIISFFPLFGLPPFHPTPPSLCYHLRHEFSLLSPSFKSIHPSFPTALSFLLPSHHCTGIVGRHPGMRDRATEDLEAACTKCLAESAALSTVNATSGEFDSGIPPLNTLRNVPRGGIWK